MKVIVGGGTNWIYRTLENIKIEPILHRILLRLFQKLPSQVNIIVHGQLEHGRDIFQISGYDPKLVISILDDLMHQFGLYPNDVLSPNTSIAGIQS